MEEKILESRGKKYYPQIESLRGIAALWVVILHIDWTFPFFSTPIVRNGYLMVDFFFILSGFVITINYSHKIKVYKDFKDFIILRFYRLFPIHFLTLLFFVISFVLVFYLKGQSLDLFVDTFLIAFFSNLLLIHSLGVFENVNVFNTASWSISVEFYAYAVFGLVILFSKKVYFINLFFVASSIILLAVNTNSLDLHGGFYSFVRCILGFNIGCLLSRFNFSNFKNNFLVYLSVIVLILFLAFKTPKTFLDFFIYILFLGLIIATITTTNKSFMKIINHPILLKLGALSYSIYMIHGIIMYWFKIILKMMNYQLTKVSYGEIYEVGGMKSIFLIVIYLIIVFTISNFIFHKIEDPYRIKGKRFVAKLNSKESKKVLINNYLK